MSVIKEWKEGAREVEEVVAQVEWNEVLSCEGVAKDLVLMAKMIDARGCEGQKEALLAKIAAGFSAHPLESVVAAVALYGSLDNSQKAALVESLLDTVMVQELEQAARVKVYGVLKLHAEAQDLPHTAAFVSSFIRAIDGERDPRCLLLTFAVHDTVTTRLGREGIGAEDPTLLEEMFDVVSCYFPISYTAPKKEKNPISNVDLKKGVLACCTHSCFSDFALPFALDKLSSPLGDTKLDALEMINTCCVKYGDHSHLLIEPFFSELWTQIRTETLNASMRGDDPLMHKLFGTVACITKVIVKFASPDLVHAHLKVLFDGILNMASVPQGFVNAKSYSALAHFAASASPEALDVFLTRLIPVLHSAFIENVDNVNRRVSILGIYNAVLGAGAKLGVEVDSGAMEDAVFALAGKGTTTEGMVLCGEACSSIMQFANKASEKAAATLASLLLNITEDEPRAMILAALKTAVAKSQSLTVEVVIPKLLTAPAFDSERAVSALLAITEGGSNLSQVVAKALSGLVADEPTHHGLCETVLEKLAASQLSGKPVAASDALSAEMVTKAVEKSVVSKGLQLAFALLGCKEQETVLASCSDRAKWYSLVCAARTGVQVELDTSAVTSDMSEQHALAIASVVNKSEAKMPAGYEATPHMGLLLKAGLMKGDSSCIEALLGVVGERSLAAGVLSTIFTEIPSLSTMLGHKKKFLWMQKVYAKVLPVLLGKYKSEPDEAKKCEVFESIAVVVSHAPASLVSADAEKLLPVVTGGLASGNGSILASALDILHSLVQQDPQSVAKVPLLSLLVPSLVRASGYKPARKTRVTALNILDLIATEKDVAHAAVTFKQQVVNGIEGALDDHKRVVRAAATQARCSWCLLA